MAEPDKVRPVPEDYGSITPYVMVSDPAIARLKREGGSEVVGFARRNAESWLCVCGTENSYDSSKRIQNCTHCHRNRDFVLENWTEDAIRAKTELNTAQPSAQGQRPPSVGNKIWCGFLIVLAIYFLAFGVKALIDLIQDPTVRGAAQRQVVWGLTGFQFCAAVAGLGLLGGALFLALAVKRLRGK